MRVKRHGEADVAAVWVVVGSLHGWRDNPMQHGRTVDKLASAVVRYGWGSPIEARMDVDPELGTHEIIAGHARQKTVSALASKWQSASQAERAQWHPDAVRVATGEVPVRFRLLNERLSHEAAIADNRIGDESDWDEERLVAHLLEFQDSAGTMGFDESELKGWLQEDVDSGSLQEDAGVPDEVQLVCQVGDTWQLGVHTLVVADNRESWAWPEEKARAVWTDPPFGLKYVGKTKDALTIENDDLDEDALREFLRAVFALLLDHTVPGSPWYVAGPPGALSAMFVAELLRVGVFRQPLVWVKDHFVLGYSDYHYRHELVFYGWTPGGAHVWVGDRTQDTVFELERPSASKDHPTMKPVLLVGRQLSNSTHKGDLVLDPHGGSGTTLIACEQLGLRCHMIEKSPKYASGIIARWEALTGMKAIPRSHQCPHQPVSQRVDG